MRNQFTRTNEIEMARNTLKLNQMQEKKRRKFQIMFPCSMECKETFIEGDEIANIDGIVEIFRDEQIVAIVNDYVLVRECE